MDRNRHDDAPADDPCAAGTRDAGTRDAGTLGAGLGADPPDPLAPFRWHPEPELIGFGDEATSRAALEHLGEDAWTAALDYLYREGVRRPIGPDSYADIRAAFFGPSGRPAPAPGVPAPAAEVLAEFRDRLAPHLFSPYHPGAFSYITPPPLVMSIAGEVLAQWANQGVDVWPCGPVGALVEEEVIRWLGDLVGYGSDSFGVLTSGGSMANLMALTVVRDVHLAHLRAAEEKPDLPSSTAIEPERLPRAYPAPPRGRALEGVRVYASDQAHFSIARALDVLGFPADTLRVVASDDRFRLRGASVEAAIEADRSAGLRPLAIAAVAGSTNTGSVDATGELADVAARHGLWLHVDAAYGGAALLSRRDAPRVPGLARADSITIDPHKWFFQAYDIGGLLVRRHDDLLQTFHREPEYYRHGRSDEERLDWYRYSIEGTRRWRALKLWLSWKHLGTAGLGRLVEMTNDIAAHLARRCREADDLEALPPEPELSAVCLRHLPGGAERAARLDPARLDRYNDALCAALDASGEGWLSTTVLGGRTWLRAGIVNYLATETSVDAILAAVRRLSPAVAAAVGIPPG